MTFELFMSLIYLCALSNFLYGYHVVSFSNAEMRESDNILKYTLVAKFANGKPTLNAIRAHIDKFWGLSERPIVSC